MKTILYLGNTYCSNIVELKSIIDMSPAQNSLLGKELLCALKDGTIERWLNEGNEEEQSLANDLHQIQSGSSDSDLLKKLGDCFKSEYKTQKFNISDFIVLQTVNVTIGDKPSHNMGSEGNYITVSERETVKIRFIFKFKVEKTIGEKFCLYMRLIRGDELKIETKKQDYNLRELTSTLEVSFELSYDGKEVDYTTIPKIELSSMLMGQESILWFTRISSHECVDLGLPSGLKWATCNVGADNPEDYGDYFAWGETETKSEYVGSNRKTWNKNIGDISGKEEYDVARKQWGITWRMPTEKEFEELLNECKWHWIKNNGKNGFKVTGSNGNSIFLPAAGCRRGGSSLRNAGADGRYWSSTPYKSDSNYAHRLFFNGNAHYVDWSGLRRDGQSVRPVSE